MMHGITFLLSLCGFTMLALSMARHQEDVFGRLLSRRSVRALRTAGWALLSAALAAAVQAWGWGYGLVCFSGHTSTAAGGVFLALVLHDRWAARWAERQGRAGG